MNDNMYSFFVSYLTGLRYLYNKKHGLIGSKLRTLFVIDEGRILFNANRNVSDFGESYINEIITKTREYGIGFIIASQETASFNQTLRSISYTKITFPLTDGADRDFISESFGLDDDQANYLFKLPKHGIAVVRYGGYENPFLLSVPYFSLGPPVTDDEVADHMAAFNAELQRKIKSSNEFSYQIKKDSYPPAAMALLYFLSRNSFTKVSDMRHASGLSSVSEVKKALDWLEANGFTAREPYKVSKRGRKRPYSFHLPKLLLKFGFKPIPGKGSFEHKLYQYLIWKRLRNDGLSARIEGRIKGSTKSIDVLGFTNDGQVVAYEVTLNHKNLISNITQNITAGASKVVVVCRDKVDLGKARKIVQDYPGLNNLQESVSFALISEFFD